MAYYTQNYNLKNVCDMFLMYLNLVTVIRNLYGIILWQWCNGHLAILCTLNWYYNIWFCQSCCRFQNSWQPLLNAIITVLLFNTIHKILIDNIKKLIRNMDICICKQSANSKNLFKETFLQSLIKSDLYLLF